MSESFTTSEKVAIFDRLYSYFTNPMSHDDPLVERELENTKAENAKLRELAQDLRFCARQSICLKCEHGRICDLRLDERCAELGIEVSE